jgi:hypothetical protein
MHILVFDKKNSWRNILQIIERIPAEIPSEPEFRLLVTTENSKTTENSLRKLFEMT